MVSLKSFSACEKEGGGDGTCFFPELFVFSYLVILFSFLTLFHLLLLCMLVSMHVPQSTHVCQRAVYEVGLSFTFMWATGIKFRSEGLCEKHLYLLSHLASLYFLFI